MLDGIWIAARRLMLLLALLAPGIAQADPADIDAAARGVVRIVIVEIDGDRLIPISHGTGFSVGDERFVTNAHVVAEARMDDSLAIGIVPSEGGDAVYGRIVATSSRNDLALIATTAPMNLPALTISGNPLRDSGAVTAVGYPMNVDRAQGLSSGDIFRAHPPVKSTGFLSGRRSTREFDSLLHTAPIARGSSGGPLLDDCGRVIGVNSFGTESGSADAEFYFAVSTRELLPFLRANDVTPSVNASPCRSLADLEAAERERAERAQRAAQAEAAAEEQTLARRRDETRREVEFGVFAQRESGLALSMVLLIAALAASGLALHAHHIELRRQARIGFVLAGLAVVGAGVAWINRPGLDDIETRLEERLRLEMAAEASGPIRAAAQGKLVCELQPDRSRITGAAAQNVPVEWGTGGCVNGRTQYGFANGVWTRIFVPDTEAAVSVNRFDPQTREYRVERYLLGTVAMSRARAARAEFQPPSCGVAEQEASEFGAVQATVLSLLPDRPNERLVYACSEASG